MRIMAPGPVESPPEVLAAGSRQIPHHRTGEFRATLKDSLAALGRVLKTANPVVPIAASGTGAMEAIVTSLFSPSDTVLVTVCGNFSERWVNICKAFGVKVTRLDSDWGTAVDPARVAMELKNNPKIAGVLTTFSETSTGVENDIAAIGKAVRGTDAVLAVDGISGVGALPFYTDDWGVDALAVGSQKGLMLPPGLAFVALSAKARKRIETSTTPRFYLSLDSALKSLEGNLPDTPFTPAVSLIIQLRESLKVLEAEGIEKVWARIALLGSATRAAIRALGLKLLPAGNYSNVVTAVDCAGGPDPDSVVRSLREGYGISIIGGQGKLKGRIFRIGHVGHVDELDVLATIGALEMVLRRSGRDVKLGAGVAAAQEVFLKAKVGENA